jgi:hypothetical protein
MVNQTTKLPLKGFFREHCIEGTHLYRRPRTTDTHPGFTNLSDGKNTILMSPRRAEVRMDRGC